MGPFKGGGGGEIRVPFNLRKKIRELGKKIRVPFERGQNIRVQIWG